MMMSAPVENPIHSSLSNDADMIDLIEEFVVHLKDRVTALEATVVENNVDELTRLAHQLKGAGGGYGFAPLGQAAALLEQAAKGASEVGEVKDALNSLISICQRATAEPAP